VLGLTAVLGTGEVVRAGGKYTKSTSGYDLTQLILGSEGTLALVTEAILRLYPRPGHAATVLAPFRSLVDVTGAVPRIVASGLGPVILEYIDLLSFDGLLGAAGLDIGVPQAVRAATQAYLVVVLEDRREDRLEEDVAELAELLGSLDALDVFVLPAQAGTRLIQARERAFFVSKAAGANDLVDTVVPRASLAQYMAEVARLAEESGSLIPGCGHAGDGNVHLSVFQPDPEKRRRLMHAIYRACKSFGGSVSGEHGIGTEKKPYFVELEDPAKIALYGRIKSAFDPQRILNPSVMLPGPDDLENGTAELASSLAAEAVT
jgi:glycolate oxidase